MTRLGASTDCPTSFRFFDSNLNTGFPSTRSNNTTMAASTMTATTPNGIPLPTTKSPWADKYRGVSLPAQCYRWRGPFIPANHQPTRSTALTPDSTRLRGSQCDKSTSATDVDTGADDDLQATVEDLDPPSALSVSPNDPVSHALMSAFERDYTHLTVVAPDNRALLGYLSIPRLKELLKEAKVQETSAVKDAMLRFRRKGRAYKVITMDTPLEELEDFFEGKSTEGQKQEFAVVTDASRRFVLGVATKSDLEEFVKRRP